MADHLMANPALFHYLPGSLSTSPVARKHPKLPSDTSPAKKITSAPAGGSFGGQSDTIATASSSSPRTPGQQHLRPRPPKPKRSYGTVTTFHLEDEVDRLLSACREQEIKIQSIKSTIEHRLYTDIPSLMHRIAETDDLADRATASLQSATADQVPRLRSKLEAIVAEGEAKAEQIRKPNTPWVPILAETYPDREFHKSEGWSTIEEWKQEIVNFYVAELVKLRALQKQSRKKSRFLWRIISIIILALSLVFFTILSIAIYPYLFRAVKRIPHIKTRFS